MTTHLPADNSRKTPLARSLNALAAQRASDARMGVPQEVPCRAEVVGTDGTKPGGQVVTASVQVFGGPFDGTLPNIPVPIATSQYDWIPVQVGDLGVLKKSDFYLGATSGLGTGTADWTPRGNLSTLYFQPISNQKWMPPKCVAPAINFRVVQGPGGAAISDVAGNTSVVANGNTVIINVKNDVIVTVADDHVTITVPSGKRVNVTAGGTLSPVMTSAGASPVLYADGP